MRDDLPYVVPFATPGWETVHVTQEEMNQVTNYGRLALKKMGFGARWSNHLRWWLGQRLGLGPGKYALEVRA